MRSSFSLGAILLAAVAASQCSSGKDQNSTPTTPTTPGNTPATVTVSIVTTNGNKSYVPNPVGTPSNEQVVFKNNDSVVHHIVMDNGSVDFGSLSPGASSSAKAVGTGGNFHCVIHPSMVGSINGAVAPEPPPGSGDGY
jgi:plastocyanin